MPNVRDHDASVYLRLQGDALSVGGYEHNPIFWDEVSWNVNAAHNETDSVPSVLLDIKYFSSLSSLKLNLPAVWRGLIETSPLKNMFIKRLCRHLWWNSSVLLPAL